MTLDRIKEGSKVCIVSLPSDETRLQLVRLGISEGSQVECLVKLPFGPVVLGCRRQEIAVGRELARRIEVK